MSRLSSLHILASVALGALALTFCLRFLTAVDSGVSPLVAARTYVFWALVCAPVAYLSDILIREAMSYQFVQVAVARVKTRR